VHDGGDPVTIPGRRPARVPVEEPLDRKPITRVDQAEQIIHRRTVISRS
jgi:hypothetical protein